MGCALHFKEIFYFVEIFSINESTNETITYLNIKQWKYKNSNPPNKQMLKVNNRNSRAKGKYVQK